MKLDSGSALLDLAAEETVAGEGAGKRRNDSGLWMEKAKVEAL